MYNRYIRNDQGTYTRIPEEEPRHTQGGTSPSGQPEHPPSGGGQQPPHWDSAPPPPPGGAPYRMAGCQDDGTAVRAGAEVRDPF